MDPNADTKPPTTAGDVQSAIALINQRFLPPEIRARPAPTNTRDGGVKQLRLSFTARVASKDGSRSIAPLTANDIPEAIMKITDWIKARRTTPVEWDPKKLGKQVLDFVTSWDGEPIKFRSDYPQYLKDEDDSPTRKLSKMLPDYFNVVITKIGRKNITPKVLVLIRLSGSYLNEVAESGIPGALPKKNFSYLVNTPQEALTKTLEMYDHLGSLQVPFRPNWTQEQRDELKKLAAGEIVLEGLPWHYDESNKEHGGA